MKYLGIFNLGMFMRKFPAHSCACTIRWLEHQIRYNCYKDLEIKLGNVKRDHNIDQQKSALAHNLG